MQERLDSLILKLPGWLRWVLVLPVAVLADLAAQRLFKFLFHAIPMRVILPYCDESIWLFASFVFVAAGLKMAPKFWFQVALLLLSFKSVITLYNIYILSKYLFDGGNVGAPVVVTHAPVWWSLICQFGFLVFVALTIMKQENIRQKPNKAMPILDF